MMVLMMIVPLISLLKDIYGQKNLLDTLDIWDMQLAAYGTKILERRREFIKQVNEIISDIHYKLTGRKEKISISYEASSGNVSLEEALKRYRDREYLMDASIFSIRFEAVVLHPRTRV